MNNIEGGFPIPVEYIGAWQCRATDINIKPNGILVISPISTIQTALLSAERIQENCASSYPGKCNSKCPIAKKIEELSSLLLIKDTSEKFKEEK